MKAIILKEYGSADNFQMTERPLPQPRKGEIRIRIKAVSFNPVDYQMRKGGPETRSLNSDILGRDLSGVIDETGADVTDFKKGDEVICYTGNLGSNGSYAEYICVPAAIIGYKPSSLTHQQAASIPIAGLTAYFALSKTKADASNSIFIAGGAGGVGSYAIMLAQYMKMKKIITTAGNEKSNSYLQHYLHLAETQIINYREAGFIEKAIEANNGPFDIALDFVGGKMLSACCAILGVDGRLASITEPPTPEDFDKLFLKNASFHSIGTNAYSFPDRKQYWPVYGHVLNYIAELFDKGALDFPPVTEVGSFSTETVKNAHHLLESGGVQGKLVMTV